MFLIRELTDIIFGIGIFVNATLFVPQIFRVFKQKHSRDLSLITFSGFNVMQLAASLHGFFRGDYLLTTGAFLSFVTCGTVTILIIFYRI
jgi:MtN3 and saliva related transmembrane protein